MKKGYAVPNALGITAAVVFVACRILVSLFPDSLFAIAQSWFHGIELSKAGTWNLTASAFFLGLISSFVIAWIVGYIFVKIYRLFAK